MAKKKENLSAAEKCAGQEMISGVASTGRRSGTNLNSRTAVPEAEESGSSRSVWLSACGESRVVKQLVKRASETRPVSPGFAAGPNLLGESIERPVVPEKTVDYTSRREQ